tara:strand:+ start:9026 stop:9634 length:609 start_codon:yes stop_codon:yes gene_type:complete
MSGIETGLLIGALVASAASTAVSVASSMSAAKQAKQAGRYRQSIADRNAELVRDQKTVVRKDARRDARDHAVKVSRLVGAQRGSFAGRNVIVDQDTAGDVTTDTFVTGRDDQLRILTQGERNAFDLEVQAQDFTIQGEVANFEGQQKAAGFRNQAIGSLATGAASIASKWSTAFPGGGGLTPGGGALASDGFTTYGGYSVDG